MMLATGSVDAAGGMLMLLIQITVPCLLLVTMKLLWAKYYNMNSDPSCDAPLPCGSMGWPFVGETLQLIVQNVDFYKNRFAKHGRIFKTHILGKPVIRIYGRENLQKIFQGENEYLFPSLPTSTALILGKHALSQSVGTRHVAMRRKIMRAFRHSALASYVPNIQSEISRTIGVWCKQPSVTMYKELGDLLFRISGRALCGFSYSTEETHALTKTFRTMMDNMFTLPVNFPGSGFNKAKNARDIILQRIESKIRMKREMPLTNDHKDALSILMEYINDSTEDDIQLTNEQIINVTIELLFSGFSTTSSASTMLLLNLTKYPEVLKRIKEEILACDLMDKNHLLTYEDIQRLKYLNCVVKESLRMSPPVGGGFREVKKTFTLEGKQIPKGWTVLYSIRETMSHSTVFENSEEFNPDRFSDARKEDKIGKHNYCVFGGGPRSCVGKDYAHLVLKILVVELVRCCHWERATTGDVKMTYLPVPRPTDGLVLKFSRVDNLDANANVQCVHLHVDEIGPNSTVTSTPSLV
ncbi:cytochrome P450 26B1-like isoform X2 [Anneissia japonica]|nr:cytochrome P450 26B1-like isoform X2 [Anneissia japonica]